MTDYEEVQPGAIGFEQVATVVCRICEGSAYEHYCSLDYAAGVFEFEGWEKIGGKWHCRECAEIVKEQQ